MESRLRREDYFNCIFVLHNRQVGWGLYPTVFLCLRLKGNAMDCKEQFPQVLNNLLFPKIFQTFRIAIQPGKLIIAFAAMVVICLAGWIMDFSRTVIVTPGTQGRVTELQIYLANPKHVKIYIENSKKNCEYSGVFTTLLKFFAEKLNGVMNSLLIFSIAGVIVNITDCFNAMMWALWYHPVYAILFMFIKLAVISAAGGGICRLAALQFARGEKPGIVEAMRYSTKKYFSFFVAPLAVLGAITFIGLFIFLLGLIGNIPWAGELIIGVFMPLAAMAGALIAVILIGAAAGFTLMFPAIAYDGADCFDAISRSFSYVYERPWRLGFYTLAAAVYGAICYIFVRFFAFILLWGTHFFMQCGVYTSNGRGINKLSAIWPEPTFANLFGLSAPAAANWAQSIAAFFVNLSVLVVIGIVISFLISFYFSASTIIYALMRNRVDKTALEKIYTSLPDNKTEPTAVKNSSEQAKS